MSESRAARRERLRKEHAEKQAARDTKKAAEKRRTSKGASRARARKAIDPHAPDARDQLLSRLAELFNDAKALGHVSAAVGAARLLIDALPPPTEAPKPWASATEALAWWRANEAEIEAMAKKEREHALTEGAVDHERGTGS